MNPHSLGDFHKNGATVLALPGGYFELKLTKHVHFVIFSMYTDFGEVSKKLKIFDFGHILAVYWPLPLILTPLELRGRQT